jgi:hypothetical protein
VGDGVLREGVAMPRYRVELERVEYHHATVEVEAGSEAEAEQNALAEATADDYDCVNAEEHVEYVEEVDEDDEPDD